MKPPVYLNIVKICALLCVLCAVVLLTGCATLSSAKIPVFKQDYADGIYKAAAVPYGSSSKQKLDIYLPLDYQEKESLDILVFIHGGAWISGTRYELNDEFIEMVKKGIAVATIDYRLVTLNGDVFLKEMYEDVCNAIEKIVDVCDKNNIVLDKAAVMGTSAGSHLGMLYAYKMAEKSPLNLRFCVNYVGPANLYHPSFLEQADKKEFAKIGDLFKKKLGVQSMEEAVPYLREYSPVEYLTPSSVPTICAYGQKDQVVPFPICQDLVQRFDSLGCTYELTVFPNSNHDLSDPKDAHLMDAVVSKIEDYMEKYF